MSAANPAVPKLGNLRYYILFLIFAVTAVNYADRAIVSIAGPAMADEFGLDPVALGLIFSAFGWSYALGQLPGGWILDRFGTKWVYAASITLWSAFTLFQGLVGFVTGGAAFALLFGLRFMVGLSEAPSFPANARLVSAWFPSVERGFASAVFNSAQYFATVIFAPFMAWIVHDFGWRKVFWVMGVLGFGVALTWIRVIHSPRQHPRMSQQELALLSEGGALLDSEESTQATRKGHGWDVIRQLLTNRMLVGIYLAQYSITTLTYFFLTWFPVYLVKERGFTILQAGFAAVAPALCGFLGGILGGIISDRLLKSTGSLTLARKAPIVAGMLLSTVIIACNFVDSSAVVVALIALAFFGKGIGSLGWAVVSDTSPRQAPGLNAGLFNTFGNLAGITTPIAIGYIVKASGGSFAGALAFVALNALVALASYLLVVGKIERVELRAELRPPPH
ncbi:MAG TPA: MFS transporter [Steroidobacteraceae bacterium]|nr:MFS transporter [Steroidobacteraceae bacterium]